MKIQPESAAIQFEDLTQEGAGAILGAAFLHYTGHRVREQALAQSVDGLLPVQRRLFFSLQDKAAWSDRKHVKSAGIVAQTMGAYHPVGDVSVYETLVSQSSDWKMQVPMTDPEGNWGPIEGNPAAASRYTEIRLSKAAEAILFPDMPTRRQGGDDDPHGIVPQHLTYDGLLLEEEYFPVHAPLLCLNGSTGIAIGIMQSWAPLNARQFLQSLKDYLKTGTIDIAKIGFGWPTRPVITSTPLEIEHTLTTGSGVIKTAGRWTSPKPDQIVFTSVPPSTTLNTIGDAAAEFMQTVTGSGILKDFRNESGEKDIRLVFQLKAGVNADAAAPIIMKHCSLTSSVTIRMNALHNNRPRMFGLKEYIDHWVELRQEQIRRIANRELGKLRIEARRLDILQFLRKNLPAVAQILQNIETAEVIRTSLNRLPGGNVVNLTRDDMTIVFEVTIRQLSKLSTDEITKKHEKIKAEILKQTNLRDNPQASKDLIGEQLEQVLKAIQYIPDYHCEPVGPDYLVLESGSLAKFRPKETLREILEAKADADVIVTTEQGFVVRLRTASAKQAPNRPSMLNPGDRIVHATFHDRQNIVFLDKDGVLSSVKKERLPYNEKFRFTQLNEKFGTKIAGTPTVVTPNSEPAALLVVRYGTTIKVMDTKVEVPSLRALIKAPGQVTDVSWGTKSIVIEHGPRPARLGLEKFEPTSRHRVARLPTMKYTGRSGVLMSRQMVETDGDTIWRKTYEPSK